MKPLRCTILGEGSSDAILEYPLRWLLHRSGVRGSLEVIPAPLWELPRRPDALRDRILGAISLTSPCDLLFIHRDSDGSAPSLRRDEIQRAVGEAWGSALEPTYVSVVPIRETEAWFLFDEGALRSAAGNPRGTVPLNLPSLSEVESLPDPKSLLISLIQKATELSGRRRKGSRPEAAVHRLASLIQDFSPLRRLTAFRALEEEVNRLVRLHGWDAPSS